MKDIEFLKKNDIDVEEGLEILGDIDMYNDTLKDFLEESKDRLPKIEEYKNNNDMENYAIEVHAMKGDSKYLGFTKLAELSLEHQLKSQENNIDYVKANYNELIEEANRVIKVVSEYFKV
jgi:HPt (histidine-containing phosphotransfer) domain-containing protein